MHECVQAASELIDKITSMKEDAGANGSGPQTGDQPGGMTPGTSGPGNTPGPGGNQQNGSGMQR